MPPFKNASVAAKFESYPPVVRRKLLALRGLVSRTARSHPEVAELEETLKWGEPAYVTRNGAGSTVRMDWKAKDPNRYAMYFHCQTNLVESFRSMFPNDFKFDGNRARNAFRLMYSRFASRLRSCTISSARKVRRLAGDA